MADPYGLELSGLTPELSAEAAALARRQKVAEAMGMQAQQGLPVNRMAGNMAISISPFEGAAQLMRAYSSRKALDDVDAKRQDIARRGREAVANEIARVQGIGADKPGQVFQPATPNDDEGNAIPSAQGPAIPGDKNRMVTEAMMSALPQVQRYGQVLSGQVQADKTLAATQAQADKVLAVQQEFQREQKIADRQARLDAITMQLSSRELEGEQNRAMRERLEAQGNELKRELAQAKIEAASIAKSVMPTFLPQDTPQGIMAFNNRTGQMTPVTVDGKTVMRSGSDPTQQGAVAGAKESGKQQGKATTLAQINLPQVEAQAKQSLDLVDALVSHPGKSWSVGPASMTQTKRIPGTPAADFQARLDQVKGQQFLAAFETLKGAGQITEVEGKKATDAISRMSTSTSIKEFDKAAEEYKQVVKGAVDRAKQRAQPVAPAAPAGGGAPSLPRGYKPL